MAAPHPSQSQSQSQSPFPLDARLTTVAVGCLGMLVIGLLVLMLLIGGLVYTVEDRTAGVVIVAPSLVLFVAAIVGVVLWKRRCRSWLEGTVLVVQGPFGRKRCDLATAVIGVGSFAETRAVSAGQYVVAVPTGRRIPVLRARDPFTGTQVALPLRTRERNLLPAPQMVALAWAIEAGTRPEPFDQQAEQIAARLRSLAADPFAGHL